MSVSMSEKIALGSFICTLMVILRHSLNLQAFWGTEDIYNTCSFIELGFSKLTEIAVPFFFIISGFFFFRESFYSKRYYQTLKKKVKTLVIPFLFWNIVGGIVLFILKKEEFGSSISEGVMNLLLSKWYGPLWYVRNLLIMMIAVPLYGWIFNVNKDWLYILILSSLFLWWYPVDCAWWSSEGWLFFILGGMLQHRQKILSIEIPFVVVILMICLWASLCFFRPVWSMELNKLTTLLGVFTFWQILNKLGQNIVRFMGIFVSYSFFIYVNHFWLVKGMKVYLASLFPQDESVALIAYWGLPIITLGILLWIGMMWKRVHIQSFLLVTGGRG